MHLIWEIEVQGFSKDDACVFLIYKKAKEIGANTFSLKLLKILMVSSIIQSFQL
jgi:hypothetical protein